MSKIRVREVVTTTRTAYVDFDKIGARTMEEASRFMEDYLNNFSVASLDHKEGGEFIVTIEDEIIQHG